jgi:hypothetical protein
VKNNIPGKAELLLCSEQKGSIALATFLRFLSQKEVTNY